MFLRGEYYVFATALKYPVFLSCSCIVKKFADFLSHTVQRNAFGTTDMTLPLVVWPRTEYQHTTRRDGIEEAVGGFIIVTEAVVGQQNEGMLLSEEDRLHGLLLR